MKKERRVKKTQEFQEILGKKHSVSCKEFVVYYSPKKEEKNRIGISAGKKLGNAVVRNLTKRQMRMMLRECGALEMNQDLIVIVRPTYHQDDYENHKKHLESLLKKVTIRATSDRKGEAK